MTEVSFGEWLKRQRNSRGLTQEQLAHQIGCATITLRKIESEERHPSAAIVEQLGKIFEIPQQEQTSFLQFARGDWTKAPGSSLDDKPWQSPKSPRTNLPVSLTSFIGREKEQGEVIDLLTKHRLVTLTGAGGIGKTRLSIQVGQNLLSDFPNGTWFVELAPILDPLLVPHTTAIAIGLRDEGQRPVIDMLCEYLRDKQMLIILDNCEHLIDACVSMTDKLLHATSNLHVLASSREVLGVPGEVNYRVPPLELPDVEHPPSAETLNKYEAFTLFIERAKSTVPYFTVTNENALALAQICCQLDGIPLAIELAAGKVHVLSVEQIAKRLDDRFRLLTSGRRFALERHQTLRATIEWSYNLLSTSEQILFRRLSIFVDGWMLDAAESICVEESVTSQDILNLLEQLINKSLVITRIVQGEPRYHMLETIRQYAYEKLVEAGEMDSLRHRHLVYFLDLAEQANREQFGQIRDQWKDRIERDDDNFRAALTWCLSEKSTEYALRLFGAWAGHGYHGISERFDWFNKVRTLPNLMGFPVLYAKLLNDTAWDSWLHGNDDGAKSLIEESKAIWLSLGTDGEPGLAESLRILGAIMLRWNDIKTAHSLFEQSLTLFQKYGHKWGIARTIFDLGHMALSEERYIEAEEQFKKSLAIWKDLGDELVVAYAYNELGMTAQMQGDYERADRYYEHCIKISRKRRSGLLSAPLLNSGWIALRTGDDQNARRRYEEGLKLCQEDGDNYGMIICLAGFAAVLGIRGKFEKAARLFGAFESLLEGSKMHLDPMERKEIDHFMAVVRTQLDEATWTKAWTEGCEIKLEEAIEYALKELGEN